jgi:hypothetical protein
MSGNALWSAVLAAALVLGGLSARAQSPNQLPDVLDQTPGNSSTRNAIPSEEELKRAHDGIRVIFEDDAARARTAKDKSSLASQIFEKREIASNSAEKYALLTASLNFAAKGEDVVLFLKITDEVSREYAVDRISLVAPRIGDLSGPVNPNTWPAISERLQSLTQDCVEDGRFDEANQITNAFAALAKRAKDSRAVNAATTLRKGVADKKKAFEKASELSAAANAPGADLKKITEYGRFLCFNQRAWVKGLPYLARGEDASLSELARNEIRGSSADQRVAVAEAWASYAEKAPPTDRQAARDHAVEILTAILPSLDGLAKIRVEKLVDDVLMASNGSGKEMGAWTVVFRSADPKIWNTDSPNDAQNYAVPLAGLPANVKFLRIKRANGSAIILPITKNSLDKSALTGRYRFQGAKIVSYSATLLGIVDATAEVIGKQGQVAVGVAPESLSGWGFGVVILSGAQGVCWHGKPISMEPLEIAVLTRGLTPEERKFLLE